MIIDWKDEYNIGIQLIDNQHKGFIEIFNRLYESFMERKPELVLTGVLKQLEAYTEFHFSTEEAYFDEFCYAEFEFHKSQHQLFRDRLLDLRNRFLAGKEHEQLTAELVDMLDNWFIHHIRTEDPKYVPCFREHGLK